MTQRLQWRNYQPMDCRNYYTTASRHPTIVLDERWQYLNDRINLLLKRADRTIIRDYPVLFLNQRVAFGHFIPVSFLATLGILCFSVNDRRDQSLRMIMALGIIVDDAIVVAEDILTLYQSGQRPIRP